MSPLDNRTTFIPSLWSAEVAKRIKENAGLFVPQYRPGALSPNTPEGDEIDAMLTIAGIRATPKPVSGRWRDFYKDVLADQEWELHFDEGLREYTLGPRRLRNLAEWRRAVSELLEQVNAAG